MKTLKIKTLILIFLCPFYTYPQQFWSLTNEFWGGPKTGITLVNDSILFVSTTNGVLKSTDEGERFEQVLTATSVFTIFSSRWGKVYAGGLGKVYSSEDFGLSWDSVSLNSVFPVTQFVENRTEGIFSITGEWGEGDGVFFSDNGGGKLDGAQ